MRPTTGRRGRAAFTPGLAVFTTGFAALAPGLAAVAAGALLVFAVVATSRADEPPPPDIPACDAPDGASSVERQYQTMAMLPFERGALKIGPVKDLGIFPPSTADNQYATTEMFVKAVRFCETVITLPDGQIDPTYWRIPLTFNIRNWIAESVYCSLKHDVWENGCVQYRRSGAAPN